MDTCELVLIVEKIEWREGKSKYVHTIDSIITLNALQEQNNGIIPFSAADSLQFLVLFFGRPSPGSARAGRRLGRGKRVLFNANNLAIYRTRRETRRTDGYNAIH